MSTNALHTTFIISETVRDSGLVPKDHFRKWPMGYQVWFEAAQPAKLNVFAFIFAVLSPVSVIGQG